MGPSIEMTAGDLHGSLIVRCAGGDRAALRGLYETEAARMLGVAQRILRRRELAEEAVHDAFVQVWRRAETFRPERGPGRAWLYAVLRNRALALLRDDGRDDAGGGELPETADDAPDPEAIVVGLSERSALRRCLEGLESRRRQAIVLAYAQGLTHGEVAGRMGVPLGTAKAWIRRSLAALRDCMG